MAINEETLLRLALEGARSMAAQCDQRLRQIYAATRIPDVEAPPVEAPRKKRRMSAKGRAAIAAAQRARWAKKSKTTARVKSLKAA
jgi:hypothetical protein